MNELVAKIIIGVSLGLIAFWVETRSETPSSVEQPKRDALRERLRKAVKKAGWTLVILCLLFVGCKTPAVYIPSGEPVRNAKTLRHVDVEVILPSGQIVVRTMDIPAGWYFLPDPGI